MITPNDDSIGVSGVFHETLRGALAACAGDLADDESTNMRYTVQQLSICENDVVRAWHDVHEIEMLFCGVAFNDELRQRVLLVNVPVRIYGRAAEAGEPEE